MKIVLDEARCTSLGMCESVAPDFFEVGENGELNLLATRAPEEKRGLVQEAVDACPTGALSLKN